MRIDIATPDPTRYIIEHEGEIRLEMMEWPNKTLSLLLDAHQLAKSGDKEEKVNRILQAARDQSITLRVLQIWREKLLKEGNRHIFIYDIVEQDANRIKSTEVYEEIVAQNGLQRINQLYNDTEDGLVYSSFETTNDLVSKISLAFKEKKTLKNVDYANNAIHTQSIDYHIFVDINLIDNYVAINLDPKSGLMEYGTTDERVSIVKIAGTYADKISEVFGINYLETRELTQNALYNIWKDATAYDIPELETVMDTVTQGTIDFVNSYEGALKLSDDAKSTLVKRILANFQHIYIKENYADIEEAIAHTRGNRPGFITEHNVRERTGSTFKQRSADRETPIEEMDTFGDTQVTIDELGRVEYLKYTWNGLEGISKAIPTIMDSKFGFDYIIFTRHATLEEINHVISQFRRYKGNIRIARLGH
ncbi:hypothetical protein [Paenibacillus ginsengarvi]|uniref:Uncharacterized protein n=1 Tax=Paenibacillus ginsengarvi TaxID=400777 RepID=A0A3B0BWZ1_9BACL|nr:hypothetical protein [Paenibacillus ginsengarvi]RKN77081.1 hypothetical protein D7M11_23960 [Paenibacillus ginsengarvi]